MHAIRGLLISPYICFTCSKILHCTDLLVLLISQVYVLFISNLNQRFEMNCHILRLVRVPVIQFLPKL